MLKLFSRMLSVPAVVAVVAAFVLLSGCGSDETASSDSASSAESAPSLQAPQPTAMPESAEAQIAEQSTPYGPGSKFSQSVGLLVDGIQLKEIRWSDHGSYIRIVFDMATQDGKPLLQVPHAEAVMSADGKQIKVILGGVRSLGDSSRVHIDQIAVADPLVPTIDRLPEKDDSSIAYGINLAKPATYALAGLGSPGRIVVDITKS